MSYKNPFKQKKKKEKKTNYITFKPIIPKISYFAFIIVLHIQEKEIFQAFGKYPNVLFYIYT